MGKKSIPTEAHTNVGISRGTVINIEFPYQPLGQLKSI